MRNLNQLRVDIETMRASSNQAELRQRLSRILKGLVSMGEEIDLSTDFIFFAGVLDNGTLYNVSSSAESTENNVYFFSNTNQFGYAPLIVSSGTSYYANWSNRSKWTDDNLTPYAKKLYISLSDGTLWMLLGSTFAQVGGRDITIDTILDSTSTNPVENAAIATKFNEVDAEIDNLAEKDKRLQMATFYGKISTGTDAQSSTAEGAPSNIYFVEDVGKFAYKPNANDTYYSDWGNRIIYQDSELEPYTDKLYYCLSDKKIYTYDSGALTLVSGESKMYDFEIDTATGCLMMTESNEDDSMTFAIDSNGNLNVTLE